jgi:hypothetical protein
MTDIQQAGVKHDAEKTRLDLLSATWVEGVGRVLGYGAKKYAADNWRSGISSRRLLGAALRHTFAYLRGESQDPETGLSHLLHASCSLMFAFELSLSRPDLDDRYFEATYGPFPTVTAEPDVASRMRALADAIRVIERSKDRMEAILSMRDLLAKEVQANDLS